VRGGCISAAGCATRRTNVASAGERKVWIGWPSHKHTRRKSRIARRGVRRVGASLQSENAGASRCGRVARPQLARPSHPARCTWRLVTSWVRATPPAGLVSVENLQEHSRTPPHRAGIAVDECDRKPRREVNTAGGDGAQIDLPKEKAAPQEQTASPQRGSDFRRLSAPAPAKAPPRLVAFGLGRVRRFANFRIRLHQILFRL
jgi:hypothetical protein